MTCISCMPRTAVMYIWSIQADVTNWVTSWHFVVALPSLVVECMSPLGPKMYWSVILLQMTHSWSTLIVRGWAVMTWEVSKTTISVSVLTSMVSLPSVTPLESPGRDGEHHVSLVALHGSKAMHEFLVLHYMATDSAEEWDTFLDLCLPPGTWIRAGSRRALALHMFDKCHVAPSHRRLAHPSWIASMKLMLDLLLGARQRRYLRSRLFDNLPDQVYVRGFSAGSYSGICLVQGHLGRWLPNQTGVHLPEVLPGARRGPQGRHEFSFAPGSGKYRRACAPSVEHASCPGRGYIGWHCSSSAVIPPNHGTQLMVIHLTTDRLCQWHRHDDTLRSLPCKYCIVDRGTMDLREHFGASEHSYGLD